MGAGQNAPGATKVQDAAVISQQIEAAAAELDAVCAAMKHRGVPALVVATELIARGYIEATAALPGYPPPSIEEGRVNAM